MSISVHVHLLSGASVTLATEPEESVTCLCQRAQGALGVGKGRLLTSSGEALAGGTVGRAGLQDNGVLTFQVGNVKIRASKGRDASAAFVALLGDGSVVTCGDDQVGGDSSAVQAQLKNVQQVQASRRAFAAILADGSVVTWGDARYGGDSSAVQDQLKNVQQVQASDRTFAAILADGSVVTWGNARYGGDSSAVLDQLKNVQQVQASAAAFAAILADGSVVTWGDARFGGDSSPVQDQLRNVQQLQASEGAHTFS